MKNILKDKKIIMIVVVFLVIIAGIGTTFYLNLKDKNTITTEATVTYVGNNYIVVVDENKEEYSLKTTNKYNVGDKVSFTMKDIKKDTYPKEGTLEKLDTVSKSVEFSISDSIVVDSSQDSSESQEETTNGSNNSNETNNNSAVAEETGEAAVISYFEQLNSDLDAYNQNQNIGESLKKGFITVVDFLFYDGTIKGTTFDELSTSAKLKVLEIAFSIDKKIEEHFPEYKEQISETGTKVYTNLKSKALELYLDITTKACENNQDTCEAAKEGLSNLKSSFSLTWDFIKEISGVGLSKLRSWYEVWRES